MSIPTRKYETFQQALQVIELAEELGVNFIFSRYDNAYEVEISLPSGTVQSPTAAKPKRQFAKRVSTVIVDTARREVFTNAEPPNADVLVRKYGMSRNTANRIIHQWAEVQRANSVGYPNGIAPVEIISTGGDNNER